MFRVVEPALIRATAGASAATDWPDPDADPDGWRRWLTQVWADETFAGAVELASPVLAARVAAVVDSAPVEPRQMRRIARSVGQYLLRAESRATPFGLFAGVAPLTFGAEPPARWGSTHSGAARPNAGWLAAVIDELESGPLFRQMTVVVNDLCVVRAGRLVVPCQPGGDTDGKAQPLDVSVRRTPVTDAIIHLAVAPVGISALIAEIAAQFPQAPSAALDAALAHLIAHRVLLTSLRAPSTVTDPLAYLLDQLSDLGEDATPAVIALREIQHHLAIHRQAKSTHDARQLRSTAAERMLALKPGAVQPITVDLRLDADARLPNAILRDAERAAAILLRVSPHPSGWPTWQHWHGQFLERYGPGTVVPLLECVADTGLGFPAGYRDTPYHLPPRDLSERDRALLALAQRAADTDRIEVPVEELTVSTFVSESGPTPHAELCCRVWAANRDDLTHGRYSLVITGVGRATGTLTGRFIDLLDAEEQQCALHGLTSVLNNPDALSVQLSSPPLHPSAGQVGRAPAVLPVLPVGEFTTGEGIPVRLAELAISATPDDLTLRSLLDGRPVEPSVLHAVELTRFTHPIVRLLLELPRARHAALTPWSWGAADALPFLPRVRSGRIILARARWTLPTAALPGRRATAREWMDALRVWKHSHQVPDQVEFGEHDVCLRADLRRAAHLDLLRAHMERVGDTVLTEAGTDDALGWCDGRAHEIVLPIAPTAPPTPAPPPSSVRAARRDDPQLPGASTCLYAKLYGHPRRRGEILSRLPLLLDQWPAALAWWYLPYRDPGDHVRLRIRLSNMADYGAALARLGAWAADLRAAGLLRDLQLDTYHPEIGRYGTGTVLDAAETVFAADSAVSLAELDATTETSPDPTAILTASFVDLATAFTGSVQEGMRWLRDQPRDAPPMPLTPAVRRAVLDTADPDTGAAAPAPALQHLWAERAAALAAYHKHLTQPGTPDPNEVLRTLLHLHFLRVAGIDPDAERVCTHLARATALRWLARNDTQRTVS